LEEETAIARLPSYEREAYRKIVADRLQTLHQNNNSIPTHDTHPETRLINSTKSKLRKNNAMIARADKGNSIVILPTQLYHSKIEDFLQGNHFITTTRDPTNSF
jgi:hypothetical protein